MAFLAAAVPAIAGLAGSLLGGSKAAQGQEDALNFQKQQFDYMKSLAAPFLPGLQSSADLMNNLAANRTTPLTESMMDNAYRAGQLAREQTQNALAKRGLGGSGLAQNAQNSVQRDTSRGMGNILAQLGMQAAQTIPGITAGNAQLLGGMSELVGNSMADAGAMRGLGASNAIGYGGNLMGTILNQIALNNKKPEYGGDGGYGGYPVITNPEDRLLQMLDYHSWT